MRSIVVAAGILACRRAVASSPAATPPHRQTRWSFRESAVPGALPLGGKDARPLRQAGRPDATLTVNCQTPSERLSTEVRALLKAKGNKSGDDFRFGRWFAWLLKSLSTGSVSPGGFPIESARRIRVDGIRKRLLRFIGNWVRHALILGRYSRAMVFCGQFRRLSGNYSHLVSA